MPAVIDELGFTSSPPPVDKAALKKEIDALVASAGDNKDLRQALEERASLKLIVFPASIKPDSVRVERTEAKGIDYLGKVKLIERSLHERGWLLDILYREPGGDPAKATVVPVVLHKAGNGLVLQATDQESGKELRLPVERISHLRIVRGSLFF